MLLERCSKEPMDAAALEVIAVVVVTLFGVLLLLEERVVVENVFPGPLAAGQITHQLGKLIQLKERREKNFP